MRSTTRRQQSVFLWLLMAVVSATSLTLLLLPSVQSFSTVSSIQSLPSKRAIITLHVIEGDSSSPKEIGFDRSTPDNVINLDEKVAASADNKSDSSSTSSIAKNTINERLMKELQEAANKEKYGARSASGRKMGLVDGFGRPRKTDEEIQASIAAARDLNGVNPAVALGGSFFAFAVAAGLWIATNKLGAFFALHPVETDVYFVIRTTQVFRNVVMGLIALASGFFGVCGLGIFLLGVRVAYGVMTGELDPTPIKQNKADQIEMPNVWDLMMNKKPNRRGGRDDDNNPFGI
jgi:hypothetical protein